MATTNRFDVITNPSIPAFSPEIPVRRENVRVLVKMAFRPERGVAFPALGNEPNYQVEHELNRLFSELGEFNRLDENVTVTHTGDLSAARTLGDLMPQGYSYLLHQQVAEGDNLHHLLGEAELLVTCMADMLLERGWEIIRSHFFIAPAKGKGFSPWLNNQLVQTDCPSTLRL